MSIHRYAVAVFLFSMLLAGCSGGGSSPGPAAATPTPTPKPTATPTPVPTSPVTINVSSSTNTHAYQIVLQQTGSAVLTQNGYTSPATTVSATDSAKFFSDLNANYPIVDVETEPNCVKPASFATTTILTYNGYKSGDISCPPSTTSPAQTLYTDEETIQTDLANAGVDHDH